jgi:HNH endonuclease
MDGKALKRFHAKTLADDTGDCIVWTAGKNQDGYGLFRWGGGPTRGAHRISYEHWVGPIPAGLEIDHLCRLRSCVNPFHLEAVTHRENWWRGNQASALPSRTGHCKRNHEMTPANSAPNGGGRVICRTCANAGKRERRARSAD